MKSFTVLSFMCFIALVSCVTSSHKTATPTQKAAALYTNKSSGTCENSDAEYCVVVKNHLVELKKRSYLGHPIGFYVRALENALKDENSSRVKALADSLDSGNSYIWRTSMIDYLIEVGPLSDHELNWLLNFKAMEQQEVPIKQPKQLELENEL